MFGLFRRKPKTQRRQITVGDLLARYDAAQTTSANARLWSGADLKSAPSAVDPATRATLRSRARYECENNSYAAGIAETVSVYTVGRGPRLHISTGRREVDNRIEAEFTRWAQAVCLPEKLRTIRKAQLVDGEVFLYRQHNQRVQHEVSLDYRLIEADQIASDFTPTVVDETREVDGIRFDTWGNPRAYGLLSRHPGGQTTTLEHKVRWVPAEQIIHVFRQDRPTQPRGISEMAPALTLFIILRQYTQATLEAAASAAYWMAVLKTNMPADTEGPTEIEGGAFQTFDLERNAVMSMPEGWDVTQMKPEHPTTVYTDFKREVVNEIARALNVPYNLAAGNSSQYNFASGRLDWQAFFRSIDVVRRCYEHRMLDRIFWDWFDEAAMVPGLLPNVGVIEPEQVQWLWDGFAHIDPKDEADAAVALFEAGLLDEDAYWAIQGQKTDDVLMRMAEHRKRRESLGLATAEQEQDDGTESQQASQGDSRDGNVQRAAV